LICKDNIYAFAEKYGKRYVDPGVPKRKQNLVILRLLRCYKYLNNHNYPQYGEPKNTPVAAISGIYAGSGSGTK